MGMWSAFKKSWNDQLAMYGYPTNTGTGNGNPSESESVKSVKSTRMGSVSAEELWAEWSAFKKSWEPIYRKFRQRMHRDPYSMQELRDWWEQY